MTPITVTHERGLRFAAQIRSHRLVVDQPAGAGGDTGPMPIELLGASLGTCVALYVQQFCASRGIPTDGMTVQVDQQGASNPGRIGHFAVQVLLPGPVPPQYEELLERVARSCPAHNTLVHGATVGVAIEARATAGT